MPFDGVFWKFDSHYKLYPIEIVPLAGFETENKINRLERENYWIEKLETYPPLGLNSGYNPDKDNPIPFVVTYGSAIAKSTRSIKSIYDEIQTLFPNSLKKSYITAYKRKRNLKDFLWSSQIQN